MGNSWQTMASETINMQNITINSYEFTRQDKTNVIGKKDCSTVRGSLVIVEEEPIVRVNWGPKVRVPANTAFQIKHPVFKNITYIFKDVRFENYRKKTTLLEYLLTSKGIIRKYPPGI